MNSANKSTGRNVWLFPLVTVLASLVVTLLMGGGSSPSSRIVAAQGGTSAPLAATVSPVGAVAGTASAVGGSSKPGYVRFMHAAGSVAPLDISLSGNALARGLKFGNATDFMEVPPAIYTVEAQPAGATSAAQPLATVIASGVSVNLIAVGPGGTSPFKIDAFTTDRSPTIGKARLDFYNAAPSMPSVDVTINGKPQLTGIKFSKFGDSPLNQIPGAYNVAMVPAGQSSPNLADLTGMQLQADTIYTLVVVGQANSTSSTGNRMANGVLNLTTASPANAKAQATALATMSTTGAASSATQPAGTAAP